jgi:hypothetical protein
MHERKTRILPRDVTTAPPNRKFDDVDVAAVCGKKILHCHGSPSNPATQIEYSITGVQMRKFPAKHQVVFAELTERAVARNVQVVRAGAYMAPTGWRSLIL